MSEYKYYEKCNDCGGEFKSVDGMVLDSYPAWYPVECVPCNYETIAHMRSEANAVGWSVPNWEAKATTPPP